MTADQAFSILLLYCIPTSSMPTSDVIPAMKCIARQALMPHKAPFESIFYIFHNLRSQMSGLNWGIFDQALAEEIRGDRHNANKVMYLCTNACYHMPATACT